MSGTQGVITVDGQELKLEDLPQGILKTIDALNDMTRDRDEHVASIDMLNVMINGTHTALLERIRIHLSTLKE